MLSQSPSNSTSLAELTALIYELLDAHDDTARMVVDLEPDLLWEAHLDYLRALQRRGREVLAAASLDDATTARTRRSLGTRRRLRRPTAPLAEAGEGGSRPARRLLG